MGRGFPSVFTYSTDKLPFFRSRESKKSKKAKRKKKG